MRKALFVLSLAFLPIFLIGCDNGVTIKSQDVPSKLKVRIERLQAVVSNENLTVYAMDFRKEGRTLTFTCPCYVPGSSEEFLNVRVGGYLLELTLLPDAEYKVQVQYWAPNADGNTEVQFRISR